MSTDVLERVELFRPIPHDGLRRLADRGVLRRFTPGQTLMRQGETSQTMYVNRSDGDRFGTIEGTVIKRPGSGQERVYKRSEGTRLSWLGLASSQNLVPGGMR